MSPTTSGRSQPARATGSQKRYAFLLQDDALYEAVHEHGGKQWKRIADELPGRSDVQCLHRW